MDSIPNARPSIALLLVAGLAGFWTWSLAHPDAILSPGADSSMESEEWDHERENEAEDDDQ